MTVAVAVGAGAGRPAAPASASRIWTVPLVPSTRSRWPVLMVVEAEPVPVTAGRPYSRQTIAAWLIMPPMSVTVALILPKIGPQDGAVTVATRISPCCTSESWSASVTTRARPSTTPGEAAMPRRPPPSTSSPAPSHCWTCSVVMPQSIRVKGSVMDFRRGVQRRGGPGGLERVHDPAAALDLLRPVVRADRLGADAPAGDQVEERVADLVAAQVEQVVRFGPEALGLHHAGQLADLAPEDAHGPVLDVEVVVLHVRVGGGGEAALGVEERLVFAFEQVAVFLDDAVAFGDQGLDRAHDFLALVHAADVVRDVAQRDLLVLVPVLVVAVEAVARR